MTTPVREKPLLIYDGDCGFCTRWVARLRRWTGRRIDYAPFQEVGERFPEIPRERFLHSVQLVEPSGRVTAGAEAVFRTLARAPAGGLGLWMYRWLPGFAASSEWGYRFVADHRTRGKASCTLPAEEPTFFLTRSLFLKGLGVLYLIAFLSLWTQVSGLIGEGGILPVREFLESVSERFGLERFRLVPSLCWLNPTDAFLHFLCGGGALLAVLLFLHVAPVPVLFLLWLFYLSLTAVSQVFLSYQWDALLLEVGFLAIFLAPWGLHPRRMRQLPPSALVLWLFRLLLFKLMFCSGVVKLSSQDSTWRNLTALLFHYETQPLPNGVSWFVHQAPFWFQRFSCFGMFVIELGAPFLLWGGRRARNVGCAAIAFLQGLIVLTGNYCFFNLLTLLLCLLLLDDATWQRFGFPPAPRPSSITPSKLSGRWPAWVLIPLALFTVTFSSFHLVNAFRTGLRWPRPWVEAAIALAPLRLVNGYGLFAVMTTVRNEIVLEGSRDGETWLTYGFKYKPGDPDRRPGFVAPHQPRLDWQMWFAALGTYQQNPWFLRFCQRLLEGSPQVLALLKENPFPEGPPRFLRAGFYQYRFTDWNERRNTGAWWVRQYLGLYCPQLSLKEE